MRQEYMLGRFLRDRYKGFLNESYVRQEVGATDSASYQCLPQRGPFSMLLFLLKSWGGGGVNIFSSLSCNTIHNPQISVRSTDYDRTLMSALANLAGLVFSLFFYSFSVTYSPSTQKLTLAIIQGSTPPLVNRSSCRT